MKKLFTLGALLFAGTAFAQTENVGIGTAQPDKSAILDLSSSNKGFLLPRMSESQRLNILKPAQGLQVYQTDGSAGLYVFNGKDWENASKSIAAATDPWLRGGNAIVPGEFIGTTNNEPLRFRVNNNENFRIDADGSTYITNNAIGKKITLYDGGNLTNHYGFGISADQLNYHTFNNGSHVFYSGGNNGNGTEVLRLNNGNATLNGNLYAISNVGGATVFPLRGKTTNSAKNIAFLVENDLGRYVEFGVGGSATPFANTSFFYSTQPNFEIHAGGNPAKMRVTNSGVVVIGADVNNIPASSTNYSLFVDKGILTEKLKVALKSSGDWADYVFDPSYKLMSLESLEEFTKDKKHLPNVPSADEMVKEGLDLNQTSKMFMEKIEELTLYIIELNKRIKELENKK